MRILKTPTAKHILLSTGPYVLLLLVMWKVGHLSWRGILLTYLPIWGAAMLAMAKRWHFAGHLFLVFAELGLLTEYGVCLMNGPATGLSGPLFNRGILLLGSLTGIAVQLIVNRRRA